MADIVDTLSLEIESTAKDSTTSIDNLIQSLKELKDTMKDVVSEANKFSQFKNYISSGTSVSSKIVNNRNYNTKSYSNKSNTSQYGSLESQLKALGVDLNKSKLIDSIKTVNSETLKYKTSLGQVVTVASKVNGELDNVKVTLKGVGQEAKKGTSLWSAFTKGISGAIVKTGIIVGSLRRIIGKMSDAVENAGQYQEALNLFSVTLAENYEKAMSWVTKFSDALYLDPTNVMNYMGSFNSLIKGLGVGSENAYFMSQNLTQLVYDLASFKNLDFETSFTKLQSAISGEIEPLRNVGVALSQNTLQELANSLGIQQKVATMNEAQKAQLRYIQILKSSTEWQTDMGRTLISPTNAMRVFKEQVQLLGKAIGRVLIPIVMELLPYMVALTQILTDFANKLASFLGYKIQDTDTSGLKQIQTGISDIGDEATGTAGKLQTMLAPFDELNEVQRKTEGSGSGLSGLGGDLGVDLSGYDALANLSEQFSTNVENAKAKLEGLLEIVGAIGAGLLVWKVSDWLTGMSEVQSAISSGQALTGWQKAGNRIKNALGLASIGVGIYLTYKGITEDDVGKSILEKLGGGTTTGLGAFILAKNAGFGWEGTWRITLAITALDIAVSVWDTWRDFLSIKPTYEETKEGYKNGMFGWLPDWMSEGFWNFGTWVGDSLYGIFGDSGTTWLDTLFEDYEKGKISTYEFVRDVEEEISTFPDFMKENILDYMYDMVEKYGNDSLGATKRTLSDVIESAKGFIPNIAKTWMALGDKSNTSYILGLGGVVQGTKDKIQEAVDGTQEDSFLSRIKSPMLSLGLKISNALADGMNTKEEVQNKVEEGVDNVASPTVLPTLLNKFVGVGASLGSSLGTGINKSNGLATGVINASNSLNTTSFVNTVSPAFTGIGSKLSSVLSKTIGVNPTTIASNIQSSLSRLKISGGLLGGIGLKLLEGMTITGRANGGYVDSASLFYANENGIPEMIGRIGNKTAVANNDQITTAITNAVVQGMSNASSNSNTPINIYLGNEKIYSGYTNHVNGENNRYGTNVIKV